MKKDLKKKYTEGALEFGVGTSNGFGYDVFQGGYIRPDEILLDQERVKQLQDAIDIIEAWREELDDDGILNDF